MTAPRGRPNSRVARVLREIADMLEIQGIQFKPTAYRRAAEVIETLTEDLREIHKRGELEDLPGIGRNIAKKVEEILETGSLGYYEALKKELPMDVEELLSVPGVGPKTIMALHKKLGVKNLDDLEKAARKGRISGLKGFGEKTEEAILEGVKLVRRRGKRMLLGDVLPLAEEVASQLGDLKQISAISLAGSIRRRKETIGDIDILVTSSDPVATMDFFAGMDAVDKVVAKGTTKSSVIFDNGLQADLRVVDEESFGSALQYFTGSKDHNVRLRRIAITKGLKLSEYGLFHRKTKKRIAGKREEEIYEKLGLPFINPELREDTGEIEAARRGALPKLVRSSDIKGDFHVHTTWSDGRSSIQEMASAAEERNYEYICICDHAKALGIARGLDEKRLRKQANQIRKLNDRIESPTVLSGVEANILSDGSLDIQNKVLKELDIVVASVHHGLKMERQRMTQRMVSAMENENVDIVGHPTGRIIGTREPYEFDLDEIFDAAKRTRTFLEINAFPDRLDLSDVHARAAKESGIRLAIGTDAHEKTQLRFMEYGVYTARRGWLERKNVLNTMSLKRLKTLFNLQV